VNEIISQLNNETINLTTVGDKKVSKKIILPGQFKRFYVEKEFGVPFLGSKEIVQVDYPDLKYLSRKKHKKRIKDELTLKENMIAVTCSGTIGKTILLPKYLEGWTGSQHSIRIVPSKDMNAGYLLTILASEYGFQLITRYIYGTSVDEINDENISDIPFPIPKKAEIIDEIGNLAIEATQKRNEAYYLEKNAIQDVEKLILENQN